MSSPPTLVRYLEQQDALLAEASAALPHSFSSCTYSLGPIRQAVYLCLTCTPSSSSPAGICAACSIACHANHEQLELFPKRNFVCDCPTEGVPAKCGLREREEVRNEGNAYGQNFKGTFCGCGRTYDAQRERETMVQCLACEDWFHESCLNLRERPPSRESSPIPESDSSSTPSTHDELLEPAAEETDDAASDASSDDLPPALLPGSSYDTLVCGTCVRRIPPLRVIAGTPGALVVVRDAPEQAWRVVGQDAPLDTASLEVTESPNTTPLHQVKPHAEPSTGTKRALSPTADAPVPAKRARSGSPVPSAPADNSSTSPSTCLLPPPDLAVQTIYVHTSLPTLESSGAVFLTGNWRERWCRCSSCLPELSAHPYLLEEEETYEPPDDPDAGLSLEELGMRALERLPRDKAIDGLVAFRDMRDDLLKYLRPFAQEGRVVQDSDVQAFFEERREKRRAEG